MNIGIDANYLIFEKAGIGKYTQNIIKNLLKIDRKNHYFLYFSFFRHSSNRRKEIDEFLSQIKSKKVTVRISHLPAAWQEWLTGSPIPPFRFFGDKLDIFFAPYAASVPKSRYWGKDQKPPKIVTTVHDLVFLRYPEHRGKKLSQFYLKRHQIAAQNSQKLMAVSLSTKEDLINLLKVDTRNIKVVYEAADIKFRPLKKKEVSRARQIIGQYFNPKTKYILSVGTLEPRKNLARLITAFSLLPNALKQKYQLVLVGGKGWNNRTLLQTINNLNLKDRVILTGFVKDDDLPYIYNQASIFVYPSLYEGFGLPVLEAMAAGVPVVTSNLSSLPEVAGRATCLINPTDEKAIAQAIVKVLSQPKFAQKLIKQGFIQAKKFSWGKAAQETLDLFEKI